MNAGCSSNRSQAVGAEDELGGGLSGGAALPLLEVVCEVLGFLEGVEALDGDGFAGGVYQGDLEHFHGADGGGRGVGGGVLWLGGFDERGVDEDAGEEAAAAAATAAALLRTAVKRRR